MAGRPIHAPRLRLTGAGESPAKRMPGRQPYNLTPRERELYRLLAHTLICIDTDCDRCIDIETKLEDGPQHFPEDPGVRIRVLDRVLEATAAHAERISDVLESAPIQVGTRQAVFRLLEMLRQARRLLWDPVTESSGLDREELAGHGGNAEVTRRAKRGRVVKRAAVIVIEMRPVGA